MRKLAYIFCIALFLFGCGNLVQYATMNIAYDPIDYYPPQFFSSKDKRPTLYIDSVVDSRAIISKSTKSGGSGRFEEDPHLLYKNISIFGDATYIKNSEFKFSIL
tara:strand:- start:169 stop:483 length:315 start_codon:yes stop_codon:yes gene_type:complete